MVRTDVCSSICRFERGRERKKLKVGRLERRRTNALLREGKPRIRDHK